MFKIKAVHPYDGLRLLDSQPKHTRLRRAWAQNPTAPTEIPAPFALMRPPEPPSRPSPIVKIGPAIPLTKLISGVRNRTDCQSCRMAELPSQLDSRPILDDWGDKIPILCEAHRSISFGTDFKHTGVFFPTLKKSAQPSNTLSKLAPRRNV